jgi:hypothetical protein
MPCDMKFSRLRLLFAAAGLLSSCALYRPDLSWKEGLEAESWKRHVVPEDPPACPVRVSVERDPGKPNLRLCAEFAAGVDPGLGGCFALEHDPAPGLLAGARSLDLLALLEGDGFSAEIALGLVIAHPEGPAYYESRPAPLAPGAWRLISFDLREGRYTRDGVRPGSALYLRDLGRAWKIFLVTRHPPGRAGTLRVDEIRVRRDGA